MAVEFKRDLMKSHQRGVRKNAKTVSRTVSRSTRSRPGAKSSAELGYPNAPRPAPRFVAIPSAGRALFCHLGHVPARSGPGYVAPPNLSWRVCLNYLSAGVRRRGRPGAAAARAPAV
ncbi:hypothetical protein EVAR_34576_1 [Eumeta japonica]|uniref:Uncharacterized protein n=1 Tax=Eumeta variegata TaxID=151549 RepID=A0A4C1ZAH0_EUMVA|nr:hypothetical protein EVAR_34576_1 [Eumeta japonica]